MHSVSEPVFASRRGELTRKGHQAVRARRGKEAVAVVSSDTQHKLEEQ
jgi:hypothetical protein